MNDPKNDHEYRKIARTMEDEQLQKQVKDERKSIQGYTQAEGEQWDFTIYCFRVN